MSRPPVAFKVTPPPFIKAMGVLLALLNLLAIGFAAWVLVLSYRHYVERAEASTQNLAKALEDNVVESVRRIDLALQSIQDEARHDPKALRLGALAQAHFSRTGTLASLQVADPAGHVVHAVPTGPTTDITTQPFFRQLRLTDLDDLFISSPTRGPDGAWNLILARRLERGGETFAGVVFATLPTEYLARTMSRLDVGQKGSVSLRGQDLALLAQYPDFAGQQAEMGRKQVQGSYLKAVQAGASTAQFTETSTPDGIRRTYALRRTPQPRFYIQVGLAQWEYLRAWRHQATFTIAAVLGLFLLTLALGWQARASLTRQMEDQTRLAEQEARYRLLAENAMDVIWSMDPDGQVTYVSPSILRQRGWTPEEFLSLSPENRALSRRGNEIVQKLIARTRGLAPGSQPFEHELIQVGAKHKDGREIQVEVQSRVVWGEDGCLLGFQGVTRDITERKRMEVERERLIQGLTQALADVKQLSGMLPICSSCKKVRDDHGYWSQIETYLSEHTEATFTHGVCPDCAQKFREEIQARRVRKEDEASS